ncbi:hypothetical protein Tco_0579073 [Tanacetum coccineum]
MVSFQRLHSHLKCLSNNDLKGSRTEEGFKRAFATLFGQDLETFTGTMLHCTDQLQKQLDNEEFQEIGSMSAFKVLQTQFQMFIKSRFYLDDEYVDMIRNKFLQYTRLAIPEFRDTLNQHMESVKKSIGERAQHKMHSVIIESNGTKSKEQDTSSRSGNDAHVDDADIRPINNEEPMAEVQMTADDNVSAIGQQHTEQPEFINEGEVDQNAEQCHDIRPMPAKLTDNRTTELSNQLLESDNVCLKKTVAQCQKDFAKLEAHCINLELQMQNNVLKSGQQSQFLKEKSNEAKVKNDIDVTETTNIDLEHSVAKLLAENEQLHKEKEHLKQTYKDLFDSIKRTRVHRSILQRKDSEFWLRKERYLIKQASRNIYLMIINDVWNKAFKPRSSCNEVWIHNSFRPRTSTTSNVCENVSSRPRSSRTNRRQIMTTLTPLPPRPNDCSFTEKDRFGHNKNKKDEERTVIHNKARLVAKGRRLTCSAGKVRDPDHPEKVYHLRTSDPPVPKRYFYQSGQHFQTLIMPDALILVKALLEETVPFDKLCKLDVQRNKTALQVFSIGRVFGVICKLSQLMGLRTQLSDYGFNTNKIPLYSDSHSALAISSPRTTLHGQHTILGIPSKRNRLKMEIN